MGGVTNPPNSRSRRAQRKFSGQKCGFGFDYRLCIDRCRLNLSMSVENVLGFMTCGSKG